MWKRAGDIRKSLAAETYSFCQILISVLKQMIKQLRIEIFLLKCVKL